MIEFNESIKNDKSIEAEAVRLYLEIKGGQTFHTTSYENGKMVPISFITPIGLDMKTCTLQELKKYKPKSNAQKMFKERMIKIRNNEIIKDELIELGKSGLSKSSRLYPK